MTSKPTTPRDSYRFSAEEAAKSVRLTSAAARQRNEFSDLGPIAGHGEGLAPFDRIHDLAGAQPQVPLADRPSHDEEGSTVWHKMAHSLSTQVSEKSGAAALLARGRDNAARELLPSHRRVQRITNAGLQFTGWTS